MSDRDERELREEKDGITRRDFLDGAAVSAAGLAAAAALPGLTGAEAMAHVRGGDPPLPPGYYPPTLSDPYTGEPAQVIRRTIKIDGPPPSKPSQVHSTKGGPGINARVEDTREKYDCVIVGAGASGISAAKWYQDRFGPDKKVLIIDQLPDFGGHSHRNEFHVPNAANGGADVMTLRNGGTVNLDSIGTWGKDGRPGSRAPTDSMRWTSSPGPASTPPPRPSGRAVARPASRPRSGSTSGCCSPPPSSAPTT